MLLNVVGVLEGCWIIADVIPTVELNQGLHLFARNGTLIALILLILLISLSNCIVSCMNRRYIYLVIACTRCGVPARVVPSLRRPYGLNESKVEI